MYKKIFLLLSVVTLLEARSYTINNNTANVLRLNIVRDHFSPRQIKLNAYESNKVVSDIEDVYVQDNKQLPACSKQLNLIDIKTSAQVASIPFNDQCKNVDVRIQEYPKNKYKVEAKIK
jgi:hypothetical protein